MDRRRGVVRFSLSLSLFGFPCVERQWADSCAQDGLYDVRVGLERVGKGKVRPLDPSLYVLSDYRARGMNFHSAGMYVVSLLFFCHFTQKARDRFRRRDSKAYYPKNEREVFEILGLEWVHPTMRNADA